MPGRVVEEGSAPQRQPRSSRASTTCADATDDTAGPGRAITIPASLPFTNTGPPLSPAATPFGQRTSATALVAVTAVTIARRRSKRRPAKP